MIIWKRPLGLACLSLLYCCSLSLLCNMSHLFSSKRLTMFSTGSGDTAHRFHLCLGPRWLKRRYASRIRNVFERYRYSNSFVSEYRLESLRYDFINNFLGSLFVIQKRKIRIRFRSLQELAQWPPPLLHFEDQKP